MYNRIEVESIYYSKSCELSEANFINYKNRDVIYVEFKEYKIMDGKIVIDFGKVLSGLRYQETLFNIENRTCRIMLFYDIMYWCWVGEDYNEWWDGIIDDIEKLSVSDWIIKGIIE